MRILSDGTKIEFDSGRIDDWCVYVTRPNKPRNAPKDTDYFASLVDLHGKHPMIYDDYVAVYDATSRVISEAVFEMIEKLSKKYPPELQVDVELLLVVLYAAMIAEENRAHTKLGKRIKRLGIHQILFDKLPIPVAANFSKGMGWREISEHCKQRGF